MKISSFGSIHQLTFLPYLLPVNCFLVEEENGFTLIDTALPYCAKHILKAAKQLGKPITRIVITHAHEDHLGCLDTIKQELGNVPVYLSARDTRLLEGDMSLDPGESQKPIKGGTPKKIKTRPDVQLHDGDKIGSLQAISTPGHTPGSMSFMDTRNQILIAGDALFTQGGVAVAGKFQILFPFPSMATWDKGVALASAKKILQLNPSLLCVGHGNMLKQPKQGIERAIQALEKELKV